MSIDPRIDRRPVRPPTGVLWRDQANAAVLLDGQTPAEPPELQYLIGHGGASSPATSAWDLERANPGVSHAVEVMGGRRRGASRGRQAAAGRDPRAVADDDLGAAAQALTHLLAAMMYRVTREVSLTAASTLATLGRSGP